MRIHRKLKRLLFAVLSSLACVTTSAEAKCPKIVTGVWSGLLQLDSFQSGGGYSDKGTALLRVTFASGGAYEASLFSRNSLDREGTSGKVTGAYTYTSGRCSGQLNLRDNDYRFVVTDSGRAMVGMLLAPRDSGESDVANFTLYRE